MNDSNQPKIEIDSGALDYRIYVHENFSKSDFDGWVLKNLNLSTGMSVLDVGCGTGKHLFDISDTVGSAGSVVGADISDESLKKCADKIKERNAANISLVKADLTEISEKVFTGPFDRVLSSFAIYYTKEPRKTFRDLHAQLKPGGRLFICGPTAKNNMEFLDLVKQAGGSFSEDFLRWSYFLEHDAVPMLKKEFGNVEVQYFNNPIEFPDADVLLKYWKATPLYKESLENKMNELTAEIFKNSATFTSNKVIIGITCNKTS